MFMQRPERRGRYTLSGRAHPSGRLDAARDFGCMPGPGREEDGRYTTGST